MEGGLSLQVVSGGWSFSAGGLCLEGGLSVHVVSGGWSFTAGGLCGEWSFTAGGLCQEGGLSLQVISVWRVVFHCMWSLEGGLSLHVVSGGWSFTAGGLYGRWSFTAGGLCMDGGLSLQVVCVWRMEGDLFLEYGQMVVCRGRVGAGLPLKSGLVLDNALSLSGVGHSLESGLSLEGGL